MDDFKKITYGVLAGFATLMVVWLLFIFVNACGFDVACQKGAALPDVTPVPTLIPRDQPVAAPVTGGAGQFDKCTVHAIDLLGAWVEAGYPESDTFVFTDVNGNPCEGTFNADIWPLLNDNNVWYPASLSCTSCHNTAFTEGLGGLDLTSYAGILAGSGRTSTNMSAGADILGGGNWKNSLLFQSLSLTENIPLGHPPLDYPAAALVIYAGVHTPPPVETTPIP